VSIYDVLGRLTRTLADGTLPPGTHVLQWDGRAQSGERTAAGIYFVRMAAGDFRALQKTVLLR
jgi:flagellar hook assembly protein FlgD